MNVDDDYITVRPSFYVIVSMSSFIGSLVLSSYYIHFFFYEYILIICWAHDGILGAVFIGKPQKSRSTRKPHHREREVGKKGDRSSGSRLTPINTIDTYVTTLTYKGIRH